MDKKNLVNQVFNYVDLFLEDFKNRDDFKKHDFDDFDDVYCDSKYDFDLSKLIDIPDDIENDLKDKAKNYFYFRWCQLFLK